MVQLSTPRTWWLRVVRSTAGNVAPIFALAALPLFMVVGLSVDTNLATSSKQSAQRALDGAALAAARYRQKGAGKTEAADQATAFFDRWMQEDGGAGLVCQSPQIAYGTEGTVDVSVACTQKTFFSGLFGQGDWNVTAGSSATYGFDEIDIAMVMDLSGSMGGSRLSALKSAARDAVDILITDDSTSDLYDRVRVALVPYSHTVNLGNYFETLTGAKPNNREYMEREPINFRCHQTRNRGRECRSWDHDGWRDRVRTTSGTCMMERGGIYANTNQVPNPSDPATMLFEGNPFWDDNRSEQHQINSWFSNRNEYNYYSGGVFGTYKNWFKGARNKRFTYCPNQPIVPLTKQKSTLNRAIQGMRHEGGTATNAGMSVAWGLLSPSWSTHLPSSATPLDYGKEGVGKVAIIMTDGESNDPMTGGLLDNWEMPSHPKYNLDTGQKVDAITRIRALCEAMKAPPSDIIIYTVAFNAPTSAQTYLRECASSPDKAFRSSSTSELRDQYKAIAVSISELRLSR